MLMKRVHQLIYFLGFILIVVGFTVGWAEQTFAKTIDHTQMIARTSQLAIASNSETTTLCMPSEQKIDLNNANLIAFMDCPGFYPNLAKEIVRGGPYTSINDVLNLPNLSLRQKDLLKANLDSFMISDPVISLERRMPPKPAFRK